MYGLSPDLRGKWRPFEHAHACYLGFPAWVQPLYMREAGGGTIMDWNNMAAATIPIVYKGTILSFMLVEKGFSRSKYFPLHINRTHFFTLAVYVFVLAGFRDPDRKIKRSKLKLGHLYQLHSASIMSRFKFYRLLFVLLAVLCILMIVLFTKELQKTRRRHALNLVNDLKSLAFELSETQRSLANSPLHFHRVGKNIKRLRGIIKSLGENLEYADESTFGGGFSSSNSASKKEVCPEKFMGNDSLYGYPFYRKGFEGVNCTQFVKMNKLVTMLVTLPEERSVEEQNRVFQGIAKHYPYIPITLVSKTEPTLTGITKLKLNFKNIVFKDLTHGETWSKLLEEVKTPYVLFAPDITHFTDDVNLERLVRMLSETQDTIIAGGSHKNLRGEWDKDCLQVMFKNWTAHFRSGYYHSFNDCIVCDVIPGPFMAKTKDLKQIGIDEK